MTRPPTTPTLRPLTVLLTAVALALAACSGGGSTGDAAVEAESSSAGQGARSPDVADETPDADAEIPAEDGDAGTDTGDAAGPGEALSPVTAQLGRRVIRTAEIELRVDDPDAAVDGVLAVAERAGGFVATTDLRRDAEEVLTGTVTLRVPAAALLEVLGQLEDLAVSAPVSRIDEQDVTSESADLQARLTNLTTYEGELRTLLADVREDTSSPDDLLRIFERIREVRAEIDHIEGRLSVLDDQVELATVRVTLTPAPSAVPVSDPAWHPGETVREALAASMRGLGRLVDVAIWVGLGVLPVLLAAVGPLVALALAWRWRRRHAAGATPAG